MPHLDDVLERLINDAGFRRALEQDPDSALAAYALTPEERGVLDASVSGSTGATGHGTMEGRQSKSAMIGILGEIAGVGSSAATGSPKHDLFDMAETVENGLPDEGAGPTNAIIEPPDPGGGQPVDEGVEIEGRHAVRTTEGGADVGFNPQPDPPGDEVGIVINDAPADAVGSGEDAGIIIIGGQPGEDVGFNPQPDPPIVERAIR